MIEKLASESTRIVSLTITEGGYDVGADEPGSSGAPPAAFGLITEALRRRRERGLPAFTVMSCDNLVGDTHAWLCASSSDGIPKWLLPVIRFQLESDREIRRSAAVVASWAGYAAGVDEDREPIEVVDSLRDRLIERASRQREDPGAFIQDEIFGDLADDDRLVSACRAALASLHKGGARATLESLGALTTHGHNTEGSHD